MSDTLEANLPDAKGSGVRHLRDRHLRWHVLQHHHRVGRLLLRRQLLSGLHEHGGAQQQPALGLMRQLVEQQRDLRRRQDDPGEECCI